MNQLALNQVPYSFASSNPLACEGAFYALANTVAQSESPNHLSKTATLTDIIRQSVVTISKFCNLPPLSIQMESDYSNIDKIDFNNSVTTTMRGETKEGLPYLAFKALILDPLSETSTPSYLLIGMKNDFNWIKSITNTGGITDYNTKITNTQVSEIKRFIQESQQLPMSFFGFEGNNLVQIKQQLKPEYSDCENTLLGNIGMSGISKKVSDFIIQVMGGIKQFCLTPAVSVYANPKSLDSVFNLKRDPVIRTNPRSNVPNVVFRLCRVGYSFTQEQTESPKVACFSDRSEQSQTIKNLESSVGSQYFIGRSQNPKFVVIEINKELSEANLAFGDRDQRRSLTDEDLKSLKAIKGGNISTIFDLLPKYSASHEVMLDQPYNSNK